MIFLTAYFDRITQEAHDEAFRAGLTDDWRNARPADPAVLRRERRAFRKADRNYRRNVIPMAEVGHSIADSWYFLIPFGLMCVGVILWRAGCFQ